MYFTDTPELRKFERKMRQKPNNAHFSDNKNLNIKRKKAEVDFMIIKIRSPT